jgi:hypothetical protein
MGRYGKTMYTRSDPVVLKPSLVLEFCFSEIAGEQQVGPLLTTHP